MIRLPLVLALMFAWTLTSTGLAGDDLPSEPVGTATTGQLRSLLRGFVPSKEQRARARKLIAQLGSASFRVREAATVALVKMSLLPRDLLKEASESKDPEVRLRAQSVLSQRPASDDERLLREALQKVIQAKSTGLVVEVLQVLPQLTQDESWSLAADALRSTATIDDRDALTTATKTDSPIVRAAAVQALASDTDRSFINQVKPLLSDADPRVTLVAARALGDVGERSSLAALAKLLSAPQWRVRREASMALRWMTQQKFGYAADAPAKRRDVAAAKWQAWVKQNVDSVKLRFPIEISPDFELFNGSDLTGWVVYYDGSARDGRGDKKTCTFGDDGVITVGDKANGYLRTKKVYKNYRLVLEYRWPKGTTYGDSGVNLFQSADNVGHPYCLEVQTHTGNAGDFYKLGGFSVAEGGTLRTGVRSRLAASSEKPIGRWNHLDIAVRDGTVIVKVNGVLQNKATGCPKKPGHIGLRLEGYPFDMRRVRLTPHDD